MLAKVCPQPIWPRGLGSQSFYPRRWLFTASSTFRLSEVAEAEVLDGAIGVGVSRHAQPL